MKLVLPIGLIIGGLIVFSLQFRESEQPQEGQFDVLAEYNRTAARPVPDTSQIPERDFERLMSKRVDKAVSNLHEGSQDASLGFLFGILGGSLVALGVVWMRKKLMAKRATPAEGA